MILLAIFSILQRNLVQVVLKRYSHGARQGTPTTGILNIYSKVGKLTVSLTTNFQ